MSRNHDDDKKIGPAIGIDLGTWKCCVGVVRDGKVQIIENERGSKTTPSYVAFTNTERFIGEDAKSQVALNPFNTVYGVKRIIGRRFDDPSLQDIKDTLPFTVKEEDGKPRIEVSYKGENMNLCPEQVSAMLLTKMKRIAESHLGCQVRDAVISVPAFFNNAQRQATKDAGAIAGLNVLGLINEPTAAALAYRDNKGLTDETICVVDLGGGTIGVSIIRLEGDKGITVLKTYGNTSIGGTDFDQRLVEHFGEEFSEKSDHTISGNKKALERLRLACEKLKHTLSLLPTARIQLDCLSVDTDLESSIARDTFDKLCHEDFNKSLYSVLTKILRCSIPECELQHTELFDKVVLVGGSTRIPYVQELLKKILDKGLDKSVNPDEAVAHGAAIRAALLGGEASVQDVAVQDVTAHAFEIKREHCRKVVFQQNGHARRETYTIESKNLFNARFDLSECLFEFRTNNEISRRFMGSIKLSDVTKHVHSQLDFTISNDGIFCVCLVVEDGRVRFPLDSDHLNTEQLLAMEKQEELFQEDEENEKMRLISLSDLEAYCFNQKLLTKELSVVDGDIEELKQKCINLIEETIDWLDCTPEATEDICKMKKKDLEDLLRILVPPPPNTIEMNMDIKQPPNIVDQTARENSSGNNSENVGDQSSGGAGRGNVGFSDPLQNYPSARSRNREQMLQDTDDLVNGPHQMNKKKKHHQTQFMYPISNMYNSKTPYPNPNVIQQENAAGPWRFNDGACSSGEMPSNENHFDAQPGSSVDPRARQTTVLPAAVPKPGRPTASGALSAITGHHEGHTSRPPVVSQASGRYQQPELKYAHFTPDKGQGFNTHLRSLKRNEKPPRERGKKADSSYEMDPDLSCDEELPEGHVKTTSTKKKSNNFVTTSFKKAASSISGLYGVASRMIWR